eukprot:jgi/Mesvir1/7769/Mv11712-RA.1
MNRSWRHEPQTEEAKTPGILARLFRGSADAVGWTRDKVGACANGVGKSLNRKELETLVTLLYNELPTGFTSKLPSNTLCMLAGDQIVGYLLVNLCKDAMKGHAESHERLVDAAHLLTKKPKDLLGKVPKNYLCELIAQATNTSQRVAALQGTPEFRKLDRFDFRDIGVQAARAFADEDAGRGHPAIVNNVFPNGRGRRAAPARRYRRDRDRSPPRRYYDDGHDAYQASFGGEAPPSASCHRVMASALRNVHRARAAQLVEALNPLTGTKKFDPKRGTRASEEGTNSFTGIERSEPRLGEVGSSGDGNRYRRDKVFGPGVHIADDDPEPRTPPPVSVGREKKVPVRKTGKRKPVHRTLAKCIGVKNGVFCG